MFKRILYTFALILLLTGTANANPLRNFHGPSYIEQTAEFLNNISRNWTDLPLGIIIITHILEVKDAHPPLILFRDEERDIMLLMGKQSGQLLLNDEFCTVFKIRIMSRNGEHDTQFSTFLCLDVINQTAYLRIKSIDYTTVIK